jgi:hypothetical protein
LAFNGWSGFGEMCNADRWYVHDRRLLLVDSELLSVSLSSHDL